MQPSPTPAVKASSLLDSQLGIPRKRTDVPTRIQPVRAAKPRSTMVAVSTPGWRVLEPGVFIHDPPYVTDAELIGEDVSGDEESFERSEYSGRGETSSSYEDGGDDISDDGQSSNDRGGVYQGPELQVEYEEHPWTRPEPPLPADEVLHLLGFVRTHWRRYEALGEALEHFHDMGSPEDLVNQALMQWLFLIMQDPKWDLIDIDRVSRGCSAELEDKIEDILRRLQAQQAPQEFNIRYADNDIQMTLAAYIKRLCMRQEEANDAQKYFNSMQDVLHWGPKNGDARSVYLHRTNDYKRTERCSVSPEGILLASVGERQGPKRRA